MRLRLSALPVQKLPSGAESGAVEAPLSGEVRGDSEASERFTYLFAYLGGACGDGRDLKSFIYAGFRL
jgi:hypothetical protein